MPSDYQGRDRILMAVNCPIQSWCGFRVALLLGLIAAVSTYVVGTILSVMSFHIWNYDVICEIPVEKRFFLIAPIDVVGPCMMSFGGGLFLVLFIEWFFIKPMPTYMAV